MLRNGRWFLSATSLLTCAALAGCQNGPTYRVVNKCGERVELRFAGESFMLDIDDEVTRVFSESEETPVIGVKSVATSASIEFVAARETVFLIATTCPNGLPST